MAVIKTIRRVSARIGGNLDQEDRQFLAQITVWVISLVGIIMLLAFSAGLAVRVFQFAGG